VFDEGKIKHCEKHNKFEYIQFRLSIIQFQTAPFS